MFFRGIDGGQARDLPYLSEYVFCEEWHWTWWDCMTTPLPVMAYFRLYKSAQNSVRNYEAQLAKDRAERMAREG